MFYLLSLLGFWILDLISAGKLLRCPQNPYYVSAIEDDHCSAECSSACSPNRGFYKNGSLICYSETSTALMHDEIMRSKGECVCIYEEKKGSDDSFIACTASIRLASSACVAYCKSFTIMRYSLEPNVTRFVACESHLQNHKHRPLLGECGQKVINAGKTRGGRKRDCHCGLPHPKAKAVKLITQKDNNDRRPVMPIEQEKFEQCLEPFPEYPARTTNKTECDAECAQSTCNISGYYHYSALICFHRQADSTARIMKREDTNQKHCECGHKEQPEGVRSTFQTCRPVPYTKPMRKFRGNAEKACTSWCDEAVVYLAQSPKPQQCKDDSDSIITFCRSRSPRGTAVIYPPITGFCLMRENELKCVCGSVARKILSTNKKMIPSEKGDEKSMEISPLESNKRTTSEKRKIEVTSRRISPRFAENLKFTGNSKLRIEESTEADKETAEITPLKNNKRSSSEKREIKITTRGNSSHFAENNKFAETAKIDEVKNSKKSTKNTSQVSKRKSTTQLRLDSYSLKKISAVPSSGELIQQQSMDKQTAKQHKSDSRRHDRSILLSKSSQQQTVLQLETDAPSESSDNSHSNVVKFQSPTEIPANDSFSIRKLTKNGRSGEISKIINSGKNFTPGNIINNSNLQKRYSNVYVSKKRDKNRAEKIGAPKIPLNPETSNSKRQQLECSTPKSSKNSISRKENRRCVDDHMLSIDSFKEKCNINDNPTSSPSKANEAIIAPSIPVPSKVYVIPDLNELPPEYYSHSNFTNDQSKTIIISSGNSDKTGSSSPNKSGSSVSFGPWISRQKISQTIPKSNKRSNSSRCANSHSNLIVDGSRRNNVDSSSENVFTSVAGVEPSKREINNDNARTKNHPGLAELDDENDETWLQLGRI